MTHLSTYNTSYGQKKDQKSKCQFDFQPLKVKNRPNLHACRWLTTYLWKAFDKGYNFALDSVQSKVCTISYELPKWQESQF